VPRDAVHTALDRGSRWLRVKLLRRMGVCLALSCCSPCLCAAEGVVQALALEARWSGTGQAVQPAASVQS